MKNKTGILIFCFVLELLLLFYFRNEAGFIFSPVLFAFAGLGLIYFSFNDLKQKDDLAPNLQSDFKSINLRLFIGLSLVGIVFSGFLFHKWPIKIENSDIIPLIQNIYVSRFVNFEHVYDLYEGFNYGKFTPNYLPFHWFPFVLPELLRLDPRWSFVVLFVLAFGIYVFKFAKASNKKFLILQIVLPFLLWFSIMVKQGKDYANTVELLIAAYYLILCISLFSNKPLFKSFALALLILSRYSLVFWLPVYFLLMWFDDRKICIKTGLYLIGFMLIFYIPFLIQSPHILSSGSNLWIDAALGEWKGQSWQAPGDKPFQLFQGTGFASWIYTWGAGTLQEKIIFTKNLMLIISVLVLVIMTVFVWLTKEIYNKKLMALYGLKISLLVFYSFVFVPYVYLFWVTLIPSIMILGNHLNAKN
ncbi:MAG: hypothetical protein ACOVO9_05970 [Bacteroidia bacterium]